MLRSLIAKFDSCSLIWIIKAEIFNIMKKLFEKIVITSEIMNETVYKGLKKGYPDAKIIQDKIINKEILVLECKEKYYLNLGDGEAEVLSETQREHKKGISTLFITQDKKAKKQAMLNNIPTQGVEICLLEAALKKKITREEFLAKLYQLGTEFSIPNERIIEIEKYFEIKGG